MTNLSSGLIGLSLLSGSNAFQNLSSIMGDTESAKVRAAKAQFTTPDTVAPWQTETPLTNPTWLQLNAILKSPTIVDKTVPADAQDLPDVETSFVTYKALDKLRILAEQAAKAGTSQTDRETIQAAFDKGLNDLKSYLGDAATDLLRLGFNQPASQVQSIGVKPENSPYQKTSGKGIVENRNDPVIGLNGDEVLQINLSKIGLSTSVQVDLSTIAKAGPVPTLDEIATALNAAISVDPPIGADGLPLKNKDGKVISPFQSQFKVEKIDGKWGLSITPYGVEQVGIEQANAPDALMVASGRSPLNDGKDGDEGTVMPVKVVRFDNLGGTITRQVIGNVGGLDSAATADARAAGQAAADKAAADAGWDDEVEPFDPESANVYKPTSTGAIVTDAEGFTYIVGTTTGTIGSNVSDNEDDLFLTKMDSQGNVVWQHALGESGSAEGTSISLAPNGDVVVAGTVSGEFQNGSTDDTNMLVARFTKDGDQKFATTVGGLGDESANAVVVGADGSIYVAGKTSSGGGDAYVAHLDASGKVIEKRTLPDSGGSDMINALAIDGSGNLLMLTRENGTAKLRSVSGSNLSSETSPAVVLGNVDARSLAVSSTGEIAVAGSTSGATVAGAQTNAPLGGTDGFVTRINASLGITGTTYVGSGNADQIDSIAFMNGDLYVGGRTRGSVTGGAGPEGEVDGFVAKIDMATGNVVNTNQFGSSGATNDAVRIAAAPTGGKGAVDALGFRRGTLNPSTATSLAAQTNIHAPTYVEMDGQSYLVGGDTFQISIDGKAPRTITIDADETMDSLADKIRDIVGDSAMVSTPSEGGLDTLQVIGKAGHPLEFISGEPGADALAALGIAPGKIDIPPEPAKDAPAVRPGGSYGLNLKDSYTLTSYSGAGEALGAINNAISIIQSAYRSLYWNDTDAQIVDGTTGGKGSAYQQAQLANLKAGLARLTGVSV